MAQAQFSDASPNAHLLIGEMPAPRQLRGRWWEGTGVSVAAHAIAFGILLYAATHVSQVVQTARAVARELPPVFLDRPGPESGGSGDGKLSGPPRPESTAARPREMNPIPNPADSPPQPEMTIPVITAQALQMLPGAVTQIDTTSSGGLSGPGPGSGPGHGPGSGPGDGPGFGPGSGALGVGNGVISPVLTREVKPNYTGEAMRAKVQGVVDMEAVVLPDGSIDPASIRITRSLDSTFGLDQQAIVAVKQWHFRPGTFKGQPVAVRVSIELAFTLR
jgi:periplasmic protein TonB